MTTPDKSPDSGLPTPRRTAAGRWTEFFAGPRLDADFLDDRAQPLPQSRPGEEAPPKNDPDA